MTTHVPPQNIEAERCEGCSAGGEVCHSEQLGRWVCVECYAEGTIPLRRFLRRLGMWR